MNVDRSPFIFEPNEKALRIIEELSVKTGLNKETVKDLLSKGWSYNTIRNQPSMWVDPSSRMVK